LTEISPQVHFLRKKAIFNFSRHVIWFCDSRRRFFWSADSQRLRKLGWHHFSARRMTFWQPLESALAAFFSPVRLKSSKFTRALLLFRDWVPREKAHFSHSDPAPQISLIKSVFARPVLFSLRPSRRQLLFYIYSFLRAGRVPFLKSIQTHIFLPTISVIFNHNIC